MQDKKCRPLARLLDLGKSLSAARTQIAVVVLVFVLGMTAGIAAPTRAEELVVAAFAELVSKLGELSTLELMLAIFLRNATAVGITLLLGALLGIFPLVAAYVNGMLVGYVVFLSPGDIWKLVPHGIFELPAVFIGWGLGLWCGLWIFHAPRWQTLKDRFRRAGLIYLLFLLPLLVVAAIIEGGLAGLLLRGN
ncbi:stage II sporulation protein M [Geoalkalibacter sp.]|uniref:stage II sporulation protein M n=1 Tax=Geoalkalibacter sp. TaxID=3041440 RepID=UPI00272DEB45|nr:stage II sporulation protein M [Geoalkalibacter sp.]